MKQLTKEQAIAFGTQRCWELLNDRERAEFQIQQECLCMPFHVFLDSVVKTLNQPMLDVSLATHREAITEALLVGSTGTVMEDIAKKTGWNFD